jgi:hypothetical protein
VTSANAEVDGCMSDTDAIIRALRRNCVPSEAMKREYPARGGLIRSRSLHRTLSADFGIGA